MKLCENCETDHEGTFGSGRFCSLKCSRGFSTKAKRKEINEQVSLTLQQKPRNSTFHKCKCAHCEKVFERWCNYEPRFCSRKCNFSFSSGTQAFKDACSKSALERCKSIEERLRLKEIGRKGGFGIKGYTENGTHFQSLLEKQCFELLESMGIRFEAHKPIPESSKVSDIYLSQLDCWIELDGIDREKKKKWLGKDYGYWLAKLEIYQKLNLRLEIFKRFEDFEKFIREVD